MTPAQITVLAHVHAGGDPTPTVERGGIGDLMVLHALANRPR